MSKQPEWGNPLIHSTLLGSSLRKSGQEKKQKPWRIAAYQPIFMDHFNLPFFFYTSQNHLPMSGISPSGKDIVTLINNWGNTPTDSCLAQSDEGLAEVIFSYMVCIQFTEAKNHSHYIVYLYSYICIYVWIHSYVYMHMCISMYICVCIHTHTYIKCFTLAIHMYFIIYFLKISCVSFTLTSFYFSEHSLAFP